MTRLLPGTLDSVRISLLLLALCTLWVKAQSAKSDRVFEGLTGRVKAVQEETAKFSNRSGKWAEGTRSVSRRVTYDEKGMMTQEYVPGLEPYHVYSYQSNGDRLERQTRTLSTTRPPTFSDFGFQYEVSTGASFYRWSFKHDDRGNRVEEARYKRNLRRTGTSIDLVDRMVYAYDESGRRTESALYNKSGVLVRRWLYVFETSTYPDEEVELRRDGSVVDKTYYTYDVDPTGNWIRRTGSKWINSDGKLVLEPVEVIYRTVTYY